MEKALKRRQHVYSLFDAATLDWADSALKSIVEQRGLTTQLTRDSPSVYDFANAWNQLLESKKPSKQPIEKNGGKSKDGNDPEDEEIVLSPFWSRFDWTGLNSLHSMHALSFDEVPPTQLAHMAAPSHIKSYVNCKTEFQPVLSISDNTVAKKTRRSADAEIVDRADVSRGKRPRLTRTADIPFVGRSPKRHCIENSAHK